MSLFWQTAPETEPLAVEAQRLDAVAPVVRWDELSERLKAINMALDLPSAGCWQVTGRSGNHHLTFVIYIERLPDHPDAVALADAVDAVTEHVTFLYPDAVLREIEFEASGIGEWAVFRFIGARGTCSTAVCEIGIRLQSLSSEPSSWQVAAPRPLPDNDVDLNSLESLVVSRHQPGMAAVRETLAEHWSERIELQGVPDCAPRQLKLEFVRALESDWMTWTSFCALNGGGIVQRRVDPLSGIVSNVPSYPGNTCLVAGC